MESISTINSFKDNLQEIIVHLEQHKSDNHQNNPFSLQQMADYLVFGNVFNPSFTNTPVRNPRGELQVNFPFQVNALASLPWFLKQTFKETAETLRLFYLISRPQKRKEIKNLMPTSLEQVDEVNSKKDIVELLEVLKNDFTTDNARITGFLEEFDHLASDENKENLFLNLCLARDVMVGNLLLNNLWKVVNTDDNGIPIEIKNFNIKDVVFKNEHGVATKYIETLEKNGHGYRENDGSPDDLYREMSKMLADGTKTYFCSSICLEDLLKKVSHQQTEDGLRKYLSSIELKKQENGLTNVANIYIKAMAMTNLLSFKEKENKLGASYEVHNGKYYATFELDTVPMFFYLKNGNIMNFIKEQVDKHGMESVFDGCDKNGNNFFHYIAQYQWPMTMEGENSLEAFIDVNSDFVLKKILEKNNDGVTPADLLLSSRKWALFYSHQTSINSFTESPRFEDNFNIIGDGNIALHSSFREDIKKELKEMGRIFRHHGNGMQAFYKVKFNNDDTLESEKKNQPFKGTVKHSVASKILNNIVKSCKGDAELIDGIAKYKGIANIVQQSKHNPEDFFFETNDISWESLDYAKRKLNISDILATPKGGRLPLY